jgi:hypothetical protein
VTGVGASSGAEECGERTQAAVAIEFFGLFCRDFIQEEARTQTTKDAA